MDVVDMGMIDQYAYYFMTHMLPRLTRPGEPILALEEVDDDDDDQG